MNGLSETNNNVNMGVQATTTVVTTDYNNFLNSSYMAMLPWLIAAIPLITLDSITGYRKAKIRKSKGEKMDVTILKAIKMAVGKSISYVCWIMIATTLSMAFDSENVKFVIMGLIYIFEVASVLGHWLFVEYDIEIDVIKILPMIFKFLWKRLTGMEEDFSEIIDTIKKNNKTLVEEQTNE